MKDILEKSETFQHDFSDILKKTYDKVLTEENITLKKIIEELKKDLQPILIK